MSPGWNNFDGSAGWNFNFFNLVLFFWVDFSFFHSGWLLMLIVCITCNLNGIVIWRTFGESLKAWIYLISFIQTIYTFNHGIIIQFCHSGGWNDFFSFLQSIVCIFFPGFLLLTTAKLKNSIATLYPSNTSIRIVNNW